MPLVFRVSQSTLQIVWLYFCKMQAARRQLFFGRDPLGRRSLMSLGVDADIVCALCALLISQQQSICKTRVLHCFV